MIRHLVFWKLAATDPAQKAADAEGVRTRLESLVGVIPGLHELTVRADVGDTDGNWDLALISIHTDAAALDGYQVHPQHVEAAAWIRGVVSARACVDVLVD